MTSYDDCATTYTKAVRVAIQSAPAWVGPKRGSVALLYSGIVGVGYDDGDFFRITMTADGERFKVIADATKLTTQTTLPLSRAGSFRKDIVVPAAEGIHGRYFQVLIEKDVSSSGEFAYHGIDFFVVPRADLEGEFFATATPLGHGW